MKSKTIYNNSSIKRKVPIPLEEITRLLEKTQNVLVASHIDPDGDALGTQLAMRTFLLRLGKTVYQTRENEIPEKLQFLPGIDNIKHIDDIADDFAVDAAVILECPKLSRVGNISRRINDSTRIINIDHHQENEEFGAIDWVDKEASSVGEMVFELFDAAGYRIDEDTAVQLYTAIMTDTGRFRFNSTSGNTMEIAGRLIEAGANPRIISDHIYYNLPQSTIKLIGSTLSTAEFQENGRVCIMSVGLEAIQESGARLSETEGLADYTLYGKGVELGILFKESANGVTRISLRSSSQLNVAELAGRFGGGGHYCAAGCTIEKELPEARSELLSLLPEFISGKK